MSVPDSPLAGTDASQIRTNYYSGLQDNTVYTNVIVVTDSAGATTTCITYFNTFDTNTMIDFEAENFDFDPTVANAGGFCDGSYAAFFTPAFTNRFIQNWVECDTQNNIAGGPYPNAGLGYYSLVSDFGIDYSGIFSSFATSGNFRTCMTNLQINNSEADDYQRPEPYNMLGIEFNETVRSLGVNNDATPGCWYNYTHVYTNPSPSYYIAYLRGSAINSNFVFQISTVTSGFGTTGQTSNYLAEFDIPVNFQARNGQFYDYLATTGNPTNTAMLNLSGQTTLKLSVVKGDIVANGNAAFDAWELLPVPQPIITGTTNNGSSVSFSFKSLQNAHYTVQYTTSLTPPASWSTLQVVQQATGSSTSVTDSSPISGNRFYRVSVP